jgi:muramoyltetrapeptide carboxypeptidase
MQPKWRPLQKNDKVRIIAPGACSPITNNPSTNEEDLEKCCDLLRNWDLEPVYSPRIFGEYNSYYNFSNTDQERYDDFVDAFHSDAMAIWTYRGGYGSDRILNKAIKNNFRPADPKLFIGFSDVTSLHGYLHSRWQWQTLHALSMRQLGLQLVDAVDIEKTRQIIFGENDQVELSLQPMNTAAQKNKSIQATISGGNLTIIQASLGTPWQVPTQNTILLFEDVGEAPYRIARIFQQFLANGLLDGVHAIVLGDFIPEADIDLVLAEFANQCSLPVLRHMGIGHGKSNQPLPLGTLTHLQLGQTPKLIAATR